jgi:tetratricopeptide (TPR) repeat protein
MGGVVWSDGLRAVSAHDEQTVDVLLRSLGRKEFLRRERRSAVLGATEHSFVHTLVRDAVYGQLPRPERVERHVRVARWIESLPEDRREDRSELLAHHYLEAIELARSAGIDVSDLEPKAAAALREAGIRAFAIGAFPAAVRALRSASEWMPDGLDPRALRTLGKALSFTENVGDEELELAFQRLVAGGEPAEAALAAIDLSHVRWRHGDGAAAEEWISRALELVAGAERTREHASVLAHAARHAMVAGHPDESISFADRAIAVAEAVDAPWASASALISRATAMANKGTFEPALDDLRHAILVTPAENPFEIARAHANLGSILLDLGRIEEAITVEREAVTLSERMGTIDGFGRFILGNLAEALFFAGEWDEAEAISTAGLEHARRTGGQYHEPLFEFVLAELGLARDGRASEAVASARLVDALGRERGDDQTVLPSSSIAAWMLVRGGHDDEASALVDEVLGRRRANPGGVMPGYWTVYLTLAANALGRPGVLGTLDEPPGSRFLDAALSIDEGRPSEAAETLRATRSPPLEADVRLLAAAERRSAGDDAGADAELARARELLASLGAAYRLRQL